MNGNKTSSIVAGVVVLLVVIGGIYFWKTKGSNVSDTYNNPTSTNQPSGSTGNNNVAGEKAAAPIVSTKDASFVSQSSAALNGEVNPNGAQTSYWYEYGKSNSLGSTTSIQLIGAGRVTYGAPGVVASLSPDTMYYYRLRAQNQYGKSSGAITSFKTTTSPPNSALFNVSPSVATKDATEIGKTSATLNGVVGPKGVNTNYWFEYGKTFGLGSATPSAPTTSLVSNMTATTSLSGLESGTTYYYRLNAQNVYGTVVGNISIFTTQPSSPATPAAGNVPTSVTSAATNITKNSVTLNGQVNPKGSATTYHFEYGKSTPFGQFMLDKKTEDKQVGSGTGSVTFAANVSLLDPDSTYYYQIVSENQNGKTYGAIFSFTTKKQ